MVKEKKWPVTLRVDIDPDGLERVVKEGRLTEFVEVFSTLASTHIRTELVEGLAKAAFGLEKLQGGLSVALGFDVDDPYGTPPKPGPWPWPHANLGAALEKEVQDIVRKELGRMR